MRELKFFYCKSWFGPKKRPTEIWDEERAKKAHKEGKSYTVLVSDIHKPTAIINVSGENKFVSVGFLDDMLRENLSYDFYEVNLGKLFLSVATYREFDCDTDQVLKGSSYMFNENGTLNIVNEKFKPHKLEESKTFTDISGHYKNYPNFGNYKNLLKVEI